MQTDLTFWRSTLAGELNPIHENDPQSGYFRMRSPRGGRWLPVAIWRDSDGILKALRDGSQAHAQDLWTWCCRHPIPYEVYVSVAERGEPWPEDVRTIGHNSGAVDQVRGSVFPSPAKNHAPVETSAVGVLAATIAGHWRAAQAWLADLGPIVNQTQADRVANYAELFGGLEKQGEDQRSADKRPVLDAGRAIDAQWKPVIAAAAEAKTALKKTLEPFLLAEKARLEAEAILRGDRTPDTPKAGTSGRRIALRVVRRVKITDRAALIARYGSDDRLWASEAVHTTLLGLIEADLMAGLSVQGAVLAQNFVAA